jgi:hypothetical protein
MCFALHPNALHFSPYPQMIIESHVFILKLILWRDKDKMFFLSYDNYSLKSTHILLLHSCSSFLPFAVVQNRRAWLSKLNKSFLISMVVKLVICSSDKYVLYISHAFEIGVLADSNILAEIPIRFRFFMDRHLFYQI